MCFLRNFNALSCDPSSGRSSSFEYPGEKPHCGTWLVLQLQLPKGSTPNSLGSWNYPDGRSECFYGSNMSCLPSVSHGAACYLSHDTRHVRKNSCNAAPPPSCCCHCTATHRRQGRHTSTTVSSPQLRTVFLNHEPREASLSSHNLLLSGIWSQAHTVVGPQRGTSDRKTRQMTSKTKMEVITSGCSWNSKCPPQAHVVDGYLVTS